jgi:hypothetical protein
MIVDNLHVPSIGSSPAKANPPLIVNPNAVLPPSLSNKSFEPIAWKRRQIGKRRRRVQLVELPLRHGSYALKTPAEFTPEDSLGLLVPEGPDHNSIILPSAV